MNYRDEHKKMWNGFFNDSTYPKSESLENQEAIKEMRVMYDDVLALEGYFEGTHIYMNEDHSMEISIVFEDTYGVDLFRYMSIMELVELIEKDSTPTLNYLQLRRFKELN
jgi:hypothetical protein